MKYAVLFAIFFWLGNAQGQIYQSKMSEIECSKKLLRALLKKAGVNVKKWTQESFEHIEMTTTQDLLNTLDAAKANGSAVLQQSSYDIAALKGTYDIYVPSVGEIIESVFIVGAQLHLTYHENTADIINPIGKFNKKGNFADVQCRLSTNEEIGDTKAGSIVLAKDTDLGVTWLISAATTGEIIFGKL